MRSRAWEADRDFRRGLTKDPVELGVIRDVDDAHRKQWTCDWGGNRRGGCGEEHGRYSERVWGWSAKFLIADLAVNSHARHAIIRF